jgi:DNA-binding MarR family transcriptional regulator
MSQDEKIKESVREWIRTFFKISMHGFAASSKRQGLSMPQIGMLFQIHRGSRTGISHLGDELGVTSAAASQMIEKLAQQGLVARFEDDRDRRVKTIALTEKGKEALKTSVEIRQEWVSDLLDLMSEEEKRIVGEAFAIMNEKARVMEGREACCDSQNI